jgi:hypothetical protein
MKGPSASLIFYCVSLAAAPSISASLSRPIGFEPNLGQTAKPVRFIAHAGGQTIFITGDALVVAPHSGDPLSIRLASSDQSAPASGIDPLPGYANYLLGDSPERWTRDVAGTRRFAFATSTLASIWSIISAVKIWNMIS